MDKKYSVLFIDLDGTIIDSSEGVTKSLAYSFEKMGYPIPEDLSALNSFIGPPLYVGYANYFKDISRADIDKAIAFMRERYTVIGIFECKMYDGVEDMLKRALACGKKLVLASSKPRVQVIRILEHLGIDKYFEHICGGDIEKNLLEKEDVIADALNRGGYDPSECLMIGDTRFDIIGAEKFGIDCLGITYGFGSREELEEYGAEYIFDTADEASAFIERI